MTRPALTSPRQSMRAFPLYGSAHHAQRGVVLIISLIMIVVVSLLAVTSMRNATSSESIAGNVRTTELATQAAEIALRHCESSAMQYVKKIASSDPGYYATTFPDTKVQQSANAAQWRSVTLWDTATTAAFELPAALVGNAATYKRPPECMVESLIGTIDPSATTGSFVITARGFGPEVPAADANRTRPQGTEVWLQSTIDF